MSSQFIFEMAISVAVTLVGAAVGALWKTAEKRQDELKGLITNIQNFLITASKEAGTLSERVAHNTTDIIDLNAKIKDIYEDNKQLLNTVREQNANIERVLNEIKQDNAAKEVRIAALEKAVENLQASK